MRIKLKLLPASLMELLLLVPIWLLADLFLIPLHIKGVWMIALPILSFIGIFVQPKLSVMWKQIIAAALVGIVFAFLMNVGEANVLYLIPLFAAGFVCVLLGLTVSGRAGDVRHYWWGITLYFFGAVVFGYIPQAAAKLPILTVAGSLSLVITLFVSNRKFVRYATLSAGKPKSVPQSVRSHNRIYITAVIAVAFLLTAGVGDKIGKALLFILRTILGWLFKPKPPIVVVPAEEAPPPMAPELPPASGGGWFSKLLDFLAYAFFYVLIAAAVFFIGRWLYRNFGDVMRKWARTILNWLRRSRPEAEEAAYTDEESGVFSWEAVRRSLVGDFLRKVLSNLRPERWESMSNRERVRYLYRRWLRSQAERGYAVKPYLTPEETNAEIASWSGRSAAEAGDLVKLYNEARYSNHEIPEAAASALRERMIKNSRQ